MRFFYVTIGVKIPFFRVLVTIESGHSLLQFVTTNCLKQIILQIFFFDDYNIENQHKNHSKIKFWTDKLPAIYIYQIFSLIY